VRPANPFSPSFGISPPVLAGRRDVLNSFESVFDSVRSPSYATLLWGPRGAGKTVLISTHILREVEAVADRVLVVNGGRLVFDGVPSDLQRDGSMEDSFYELTGPGGSGAEAGNGAAGDSAVSTPEEVA